MNIEYEATFADINKEEVRETLKHVGARLVRPEFLQKRINFRFPEGSPMEHGWIRLRDEQERITLSIKINRGELISNQKELQLIVDNFESAKEFLELLGCKQKSYQETKREIWLLDKTEICLDEWPYLEPFVEIEGDSEESVKNTAEKLGFDWSKARFCAVGTLYHEKYNVPEKIINNETARFTFEDKNPFAA